MVGVCRCVPLDIGNLVSEYDAARPEPTVLRSSSHRRSGISAENKLMTADNFLQKRQKQQRRPFKNGRFGNQPVRSRGCRTLSAEAAQLLLAGEAEALTRKAVESSRSATAPRRFCIERIRRDEGGPAG